MEAIRLHCNGILSIAPLHAPLVVRLVVLPEPPERSPSYGHTRKAISSLIAVARRRDQIFWKVEICDHQFAMTFATFGTIEEIVSSDVAILI